MDVNTIDLRITNLGLGFCFGSRKVFSAGKGTAFMFTVGVSLSNECVCLVSHVGLREYFIGYVW